MRRVHFILSVGLLLLAGCREESSNGPRPTVSFFVVQETMMENGRFIDTPDLPKLGYVTASPDLTLNRLAAVGLQDAPGDRGLRIKLRAEDAGEFASLTKRAVGKRLLLMIDDVLVAAPNVHSPVPNGAMMLTLSGKVDAKAMEARLQAMTR